MQEIPQLVPAEGWHVLHLFYKIERRQWQSFSEEEQQRAISRLEMLVQEIRSTPTTQLLSLSVVTPKADLGFMLVTPDLQLANEMEKKLTASLGPDVLTPVFSYLSMTEHSEYFSSEEEHAAALEKEQGLARGTPEHEQQMAEFRARMAKYIKNRVYPELPQWPVVCFYPMSKRRSSDHNWYALPFEERKKLMSGHARVGRRWHGKVLQLITGSTGLDNAEWGVTLFARDTFDIKGIVYEMRFDEVSAKYAEFGEFYIGLQLPLDEIVRRLQL